MSVRIAVLGLLHEANTFSRRLADLSKYRTDGWHSGARVIDHYGGSQSVVAGFLEGSTNEEDVEVVPLSVGYVTPCGPISAEAYRVLVSELLSELQAAGDFDGILLVLHGSAVAETSLHVDAEIAERVRADVGSEVVIGTALDMHANVEQRLVDAVDILLAYQTNPHVDARRIGAECRRLVIDSIRSRERLTTALIQLPLMVPIAKQDTSIEPMRSLLRFASGIEAQAGVVDVSILEGFPYADVPQMGMSVIATHRDGMAAQHAAELVALEVWRARDDLQGSGVSVPDAVRMMRDHRGTRPLLVLDAGDNIGSGSPGDSTVLLAEIIKRGVGGVGTTLCDPETVASLSTVPIGGWVDVMAGGRSTEQDGTPVRLTGSVTGRYSGWYEEPRVAHGGFRFFDAGDIVGIRTEGGLSVVLTSKVVQAISAEQYRVVGIEPADLTAIVCKGVNGPRAVFGGICDGIVVADTPGVTANSVSALAYRHRRRPMFPLEPDAEYPMQ